MASCLHQFELWLVSIPSVLIASATGATKLVTATKCLLSSLTWLFVGQPQKGDMKQNACIFQLYGEYLLRFFPYLHQASCNIHQISTVWFRLSTWQGGWNFHQLGPTGASWSRSRHVSVSVCLRHLVQFFLCLSLALRSHDQIPASHWFTLQMHFKDFWGNLFQRFWRKIVSKILEENCFKGFGGNLFHKFWRKFFSKILEENFFKDFGGNFFQRFWRKIVSKILEENCFKDFGGNLFQRFWRKLVSKILEENSFKDFVGKWFQRFWRKIV